MTVTDLLQRAQEVQASMGLVIFLLTIVVDGLNTWHYRAIARKRAQSAATSGALVYLISCFAVLQYTENFAYVLFMMGGSWVGTYLVVRYAEVVG
jgi:hypothetical protein